MRIVGYRVSLPASQKVRYDKYAVRFLQVWRNAHELERGKFVMNKTDFDAIVPGETDYLLGKLLFVIRDIEIWSIKLLAAPDG